MIWEFFYGIHQLFRINLEMIKERFGCYIFLKLTTEQGKYKCNKKMLVKKTSKQRKN